MAYVETVAKGLSWCIGFLETETVKTGGFAANEPVKFSYSTVGDLLRRTVG